MIGVVAALLIAGGVTAFVMARDGDSNVTSGASTTRNTTPTTLALPSLTTVPGDPALSRLDIVPGDTSDSVQSGSGGLLIRVCADIAALDGVPYVSFGGGLVFQSASATSEPMTAASLTGRFDSESAATSWFEAATKITEGCTYEHTNGATERVTGIVSTVRPSGLKVVQYAWTWHGGGINVIGEDVYFSVGKFVGIVNCQLSGETIDRARCDELIEAYATRLETAK